MPASTNRPRKKLLLSSILRARCPACQKGSITQGIIKTRPCCTVCGYDFNPENGFYLGAMAIANLVTTLLTVPPVIALKVMGFDIAVVIAFPFIEFVFLGTFLMFYSRILWLHLEYQMTDRLS